jgi:hypothetical protein
MVPSRPVRQVMRELQSGCISAPHGFREIPLVYRPDIVRYSIDGGHARNDWEMGREGEEITPPGPSAVQVETVRR